MTYTQIRIPTLEEIRKAVALYLDYAYGEPPSEILQRFDPAGSADPLSYLHGENIEADAGESEDGPARSFALRLGNRFYPNMKLRLTLTPNRGAYVFSVDSHDMVLSAPAGSADAAALEQLKQANRQIAQKIMSAWNAADVYTEHAYMREMISQARKRG